MSGLIEQALRQLREETGCLSEDVVRTGLVKGRLTMEVQAPTGRRWFSFAGSLQELRPRAELALPLCGGTCLTEPGVSVLSWRPGRRIALCRAGESGARFLKGLRPGRWRPALVALELVHASLQGEEGFVVPRVLTSSRELACFETTWLGMEALELRHSSVRDFEHVGRALRLFQQQVDAGPLPGHTWGDELEVLNRQQRDVELTLGAVPREWLRVRAALPREFESPHAPVAVHRDLHDGQLLCDDGRVGLLDFDLLARGSGLLDLANLSVHLELRQLQTPALASENMAELLGRALLLGYDVGSGFELLRELRAYQGTSFLRLALLYAQRPRWAHLTGDLIRHAERCLDEYQTA